MVLAAVLAATAAGCGGDGSAAVRAEHVKQRQFGPASPGSLAWEGTPIVLHNPNLPNDGIVSGKVIDKGLKPVKLHSRQARVQDDHGRRVDAAVSFSTGFAHRLYPPDKPPPGGLSEYELERIGFIHRVSPGGTVPLTVAWRLKPGDPKPTEVVLEGAVLELPKS
jgi:hypothetical protein